MSRITPSFLRWRATIVVFLLLGTFFTVALGASTNTTSDQLTITYSFASPTTGKVVRDSQVYDTVTISGAPCTSASGLPCLPAKGAYVLLPQNTQVSQISVIPSDHVSLGAGFHIVPGGQPVPLSQSDAAYKPVPDTTVYTSDALFPGDLFTEVGVYNFRGYQILVLTLSPVQYIPRTGMLYYYPSLTVSVDVVDAVQDNVMFRGLEKDHLAVIKKVDNPEVAATYDMKLGALQNSGSEASYDLLIITTDELQSGFQPLVDTYNNNGMKTVVTTLTTIRGDVGGSTPEQIRQYIGNAYVDWGIDYVLLGGDADKVPVQYLWVEAWPDGEVAKIPSDLYYGCLEGTYNFDGDDQWGEPTDGTDGGDVDLIAEVYIGRTCVGSLAEVNNVIQKTLTYVTTTDVYVNKVLMAGELLWSNPLTYGDDYIEELIDGASTHGYTTVGVPSTEYDITRLYDKLGKWPKSDMIDAINHDVHMIHHLGHGNTDYALKMRNADADALTNHNYCFVYSQACLAGAFDQGDCFAEHLAVRTAYGAFAVIMNANYGWGVLGDTDGPSQRFHREFCDAVFGEKLPMIGIANQDSKEDNLYCINEPCMRWCYYELNVFGDPTVVLHPAIPLPKIKIHDVTVGFGVTAVVSNTGNADASQLHWRIRFDNGYGLVVIPRSRYREGVMPVLKIGDEQTIKTGFIFGFGIVSITVTVGTTNTTVHGFLLGPYISNNSG